MIKLEIGAEIMKEMKLNFFEENDMKKDKEKNREAESRSLKVQPVLLYK